MWDQDQTTEINIRCPYYGHFQIELTDPDKSLHTSSSAWLALRRGEEFLLRCAGHIGGGCSRWPGRKLLHCYSRLGGGFWRTEKHVCSTSIEDYHSLCFALQRDQRSRIIWKGKRLVQKKGSEEWWRSSMSWVWTLQICCRTSYCFIFLIYHR